MMKTLHLNSDGTLNILDESKFYILQVYFNNNSASYYYVCKRRKYGYHEFERIFSSIETAYYSSSLQEAVFQAVAASQSNGGYWKGSVYQFDSVEECEKKFNIVIPI